MDFLKEIELPDDVKGQLEEKLQEFTQAQIEEQVQGLKAKNEELLAEKRRAQQEKEKIDAEAKAERERIAAENGQFKELYESQKEEANKLPSHYVSCLVDVGSKVCQYISHLALLI